jgi:hypothetical protein
MIGVLTAEIPDVDSHEIGAVAARQIERFDDDAMSARKRVVVGKSPADGGELGLPDAAGAKHHRFDVARLDGAFSEVGKMGAKPWEAIIAPRLRQNLDWHSA